MHLKRPIYLVLIVFLSPLANVGCTPKSTDHSESSIPQINGLITRPTTAPATTPTPPGPPADPIGTWIFNYPDHFTSAVQEPSRWVHVPVPPNKTFRKVELNLDFTVASWDTKPRLDPRKDRFHFMFYFPIPMVEQNAGCNIIGLGTIKGPRQDVMSISGFQLASQYGTGRTNADFQLGSTYHARYILDAGQKKLDLLVTNEGRTFAQVSVQVPLNCLITTTHNGRYNIELGNDGNIADPDALELGWTFSNLAIKFIP